MQKTLVKWGMPRTPKTLKMRVYASHAFGFLEVMETIQKDMARRDWRGAQKNSLKVKAQVGTSFTL